MTERSRSRRNIFQELAARDRQTDRVVQSISDGNKSVDWIVLTLVAGFTNWGGGYATAACKRHNSGLVEVKGLIKRTAGTPALNTVMTTLPAGLRPGEIRVFSTEAGGAHGRFDVNPDGTIIYISGNVAYYSIECMFSAEK